MSYGDFNRRTSADKVLCDKAFNTAKNPYYDGFQCGFASIVYKIINIKNFWWSS